MREIFRNKKAGEKIFSIWWFAILVVIGTGIVAGVLMYYSESVDVREWESGIIYMKLSDCFIDSGFLVDNFKDVNIFSDCGLEQKVFETPSNFYFLIIN